MYPLKGHCDSTKSVDKVDGEEISNEGRGTKLRRRQEGTMTLVLVSKQVI